jgi:hypothetical protein
MSLDFDMSTTATGHDGRGWGGKENQVFARFYRGQKTDFFQSQQTGAPVAKAVDFVEIRQVGERDSTILEVTENEKRRFPHAWEQYQRGMEQVQDGTPLGVLFPKNPEIVSTLQANHIWTVQALVSVADSSLAKIPFLFDYRKKASEFLDGVEKGRGFHALEAKLEESELKRIELEDLIKSMGDRLRTLEAADKSPKTKE